jgi:hypothetical protein
MTELSTVQPAPSVVLASKSSQKVAPAQPAPPPPSPPLPPSFVPPVPPLLDPDPLPLPLLELPEELLDPPPPLLLLLPPTSALLLLLLDTSVPELPPLDVESPLALVPALDEPVNVLDALPWPVPLEALELELLSLARGTLLFELHAASAQHTKPRPTFLASVVLVRMIYSFSCSQLRCGPSDPRGCGRQP